MTKAEIINQMAKDADISKATAEKALASLFQSIKKAMKKGDSVTFVGFGTFKVAKRKARTGRNPRTGETIKIPAAKVPKFTAGKVLKESIK